MTSSRIASAATRLLGATALATIFAIAPIGVTVEGPAAISALARNGHDGSSSSGGGSRDGGKGDVASRDGKDSDRGKDVAGAAVGRDLSEARGDRRDDRRDARDDRRDGRHGQDIRGGLGLGAGLGRGVGFGNVPVDPALLDARAAALDARGDIRAAEIRAAADRRAADIISKAEARAADLRAREATAKDPAKLEARAVDLVSKANARAAEIVARADLRANALSERVDNRVDAIQAIAAYDRAVIAAMALSDPTQQANAIAAARADLQASIDRPLSGRAIDRLDDRLGLDGTPPAIATIGSKPSGVDG